MKSLAEQYAEVLIQQAKEHGMTLVCDGKFSGYTQISRMPNLDANPHDRYFIKLQYKSVIVHVGVHMTGGIPNGPGLYWRKISHDVVDYSDPTGQQFLGHDNPDPIKVIIQWVEQCLK